MQGCAYIIVVVHNECAYTVSVHLQEIADYEDNDLLVLALHLLNRYFSMESDLFTKAAESQVSTCTHIHLYN